MSGRVSATIPGSAHSVPLLPRHSFVLTTDSYYSKLLDVTCLYNLRQNAN